MRRTALGIGLSFVYLLLLGVGLWLLWQEAKSMPLNNWGDFLSGAFAPLAFLWLVLGYFQQSEELRNNTAALRIQGEQLAHQVEETKLLVREATAQALAAAELAKHQAAMLQHEQRKGLPRFDSPKVDRVYAPNPDRFAVHFVNVGATITNLRVVNPDPHFDGHLVEPEAMLATSKACRLRFNFQAQAPEHFEFDLLYVDGNATPRVSHFVVKKNTCYMTTHGEPM